MEKCKIDKKGMNGRSRTTTTGSSIQQQQCIGKQLQAVESFFLTLKQPSSTIIFGLVA